MTTRSLLLLTCCLFFSLPAMASDPVDEICEAATLGDVAKLEELLKARPDLANARSSSGGLPLNAAVWAPSADAAEVLLAYGADPNAQRREGTALYWTAVRGHAGIAGVLLAHGADPNVQTDTGRTPLHAAAERGHRDVAEVLLAHGADPNLRDHSGYTPLRDALYDRRAEVAELLIQRGADVNAAEDGCYTPLHWAAVGGLTQAAAALLARGADANAKDSIGRTALHLAVISGHSGVARLLFSRDPDVAIEELISELRKPLASYDEEVAQVLGDIGDVRAYGPLLNDMEREWQSLPKPSRPSFLGKLLAIPFSALMLAVGEATDLITGPPPPGKKSTGQHAREIVEELLGTGWREKSAEAAAGLRPWQEAIESIESRVDANSECDLLKGLTHSDPEVREGCALLLRKLRSEAAFAALSEALKDSNHAVRLAAVRSLGVWAFEGPDEDVRRRLESALSDGHPEVRAAAATGLLAFGATAAPCLKAALAREKNRETRKAIENALKALSSRR